MGAVMANLCTSTQIQSKEEVHFLLGLLGLVERYRRCICATLFVFAQRCLGIGAVWALMELQLLAIVMYKKCSLSVAK